MNTIITLKNVSVRYGQMEAIKNISCQIERGDFIGLAGPNGAGKTTLIKALLGLLPISSGKITLFGQAQKSFTDFSKIGYLPQKHSGINSLFPANVEEIVLLGLLSTKNFPKIITRADKKLVTKILDALQITQLKNKIFSELSGGQQQRVLLARALVSKPELLIFDEPSTALDPESRSYFFKFIQELNKKNGTTIILITHDTGYIGQYANKILYLDRELIYFGEIKGFCPTGEISSCFEKSDQHLIWHQHD